MTKGKTKDKTEAEKTDFTSEKEVVKKWLDKIREDASNPKSESESEFDTFAKLAKELDTDTDTDTDDSDSPIKEADYLKGDKVLPFSSSLKSDIYLKMKRVEYWKRMSVREILEEALTEYINKQPTAKKRLPAKERHKLKQLKTAKEYFNERLEKKKSE